MSKLLQELWDVIHGEEIAGHFPEALLHRLDREIRPVSCTKCGGTNVQVAMWVRPNTEEILEDFGSWEETDTKYCEDCDDNTQLTLENPGDQEEA